jgi:hypothetical protein
VPDEPEENLEKKEPAATSGAGGRKWDWRTYTRNEPSGVVEVRHGNIDETRPPSTADARPVPQPVEDRRAQNQEVDPFFMPRPPSARGSRTDPDASSPRPRRVTKDHRRPGQRAGRMTLGIISALILVAVGATLFATSGSGPPHPPRSSTTTTVVHHTVRPVNPKVVHVFASLARVMDAANTAVTTQLSAAGSTPTLAEVSAAVSPYTTEVKNYEFELHFLGWPSRMSAAVQALYGQLQAFNDFLQTFTSTRSSTLATWLAQFDAHGAATQAADNTVRRDLGQPTSTLFP